MPHTAPATVNLPLILRGPDPTPTATATAQPGPCLCDRDRCNCGDFGSQASVQTCFDYCWAQTARDVHRLDSDGDRVACESLPLGRRMSRV